MTTSVHINFNGDNIYTAKLEPSARKEWNKLCSKYNDRSVTWYESELIAARPSKPIDIFFPNTFYLPKKVHNIALKILVGIGAFIMDVALLPIRALTYPLRVTDDYLRRREVTKFIDKHFRPVTKTAKDKMKEALRHSRLSFKVENDDRQDYSIAIRPTKD